MFATGSEAKVMASGKMLLMMTASERLGLTCEMNKSTVILWR